MSAGEPEEKNEEWVGRAAGLGLTSIAIGLALGGGAVVAQGNRRLARTETLTLEEAAPDGHFVTVDGTRLHYLDSGTAAPGTVPVLLLHGFAASTFSWRHTLPALAEHYRVLALDLRGFGYSARAVSRDYTLRRHAALVAGFLAALAIPQAVVVGNSLGGAVAMQLAISRPELVARLVLVDAATGGQETRRPPVALARVLFAGPLGRALVHYTFGSPGFARRAIGAAYADPARFTDLVAAGYQAPLRVRGTAAALVAMTTSPPDDDLPEAIPQITAPTLILWGAQDRLFPVRQGERLQTLIPRSRFQALPGCGHLPQEECPAEFNAALRAFLGED